jgi:hypothetical protein
MICSFWTTASKKHLKGRKFSSLEEAALDAVGGLHYRKNIFSSLG